MKTMLVTGGTVFVSRYIAEYYVANGYHVYVLNRNNHKQSVGVKLIEADRHNLGDIFKNYHFDIIIDTAYCSNDIELLLDAIGSFDDYIFISSGAVYPDWGKQPFSETNELGINKYGGKYGTDKIEAEQLLHKRIPNAYILRPPYLYGPMNNVYREAFVFDCAMLNRPFYLPHHGEMKLQFLHVNDLCRFIDVLISTKPKQHIFNVGNKETVSIREWVEICYRIVGKKGQFINVNADINQSNYFSFQNYEYYLDVTKQHELLNETIALETGLGECFNWYQNNADKVNKKPFIDYIETNFNSLKY